MQPMMLQSGDDGHLSAAAQQQAYLDGWQNDPCPNETHASYSNDPSPRSLFDGQYAGVDECHDHRPYCPEAKNYHG